MKLLPISGKRLNCTLKYWRKMADLFQRMTLRGIIRDAGLTVDEFIALLHE